METFNPDRRRFIKGAAASLALAAISSPAWAFIRPSKTYRVALIGTGWYGKSDLFRLIQVAPVEVIALCDVDKHQLSEAAAMVAQRQTSRKTPATYSDYRKMLADHQLDIVLIGTPDHWHALTAIAAISGSMAASGGSVVNLIW